MPVTRPVITLITDFGSTDAYVGAMKGVILSIEPGARIVDVSHDIPRGDVQHAAWVLSQSYPWFPNDSLHVVVVDPGVGGARRPILVSTENHFFLAPDNGVLSWVYRREELYGAWELTEAEFFRKPVAMTFHGRDIFAAVAGWMFKGLDSSRFGEPIEDHAGLSRFEIPVPAEIRPKVWKGCILHADRFGNLLTNLTTREVPLDETGLPAAQLIKTRAGEFRQVSRCYEEGDPGTPSLVLGGTGFYEIAVRNESAAAALGLSRGNEVAVLVKSEFKEFTPEEQDRSFLI